MNREIKFRAWNKKENKIYYNIGVGSLLFVNYEWDNDLECFTVEETYDEKELEIMQYTGLKDRNGKEIYEGDIIKQVVPSSREYCYTRNYDENNFEVVFKYGSFLLQRPYQNKVYTRGVVEIDEFVGFECFEVIGNIYENSELLKEEK